VKKGQRALTSFRSAFRKALKDASRDGSKPQEGERAVPMVAAKILELVRAAEGGAQHVEHLRELSGDTDVDRCYLLDTAGLLARAFTKVKQLVPCCKTLQREVEKNKGNMTYAMSALRPWLAKAVAQALRDAIPSFLVTELVVPPTMQSLKEQIFGPQTWAQSESHISANVTPFGVAEIRVLLSGAYVVAGVPLEKIDGTTIKDKIESTLSEQGFGAFLSCATQEGRGFWATHDSEFTGVLVPAGHMVLTVGMHDNESESQGSYGLRWSYMQPKAATQLAAAAARNKAIMDAWPEAQTEDYKCWQTVLERLRPAS
jgi:hypothetical protein